MSNKSYYSHDRNYTDIIHEKLAIKIIYPKFGWLQKINKSTEDVEDAAHKDVNMGIDYEAVDTFGRKIILQERFRWAGYNDFTIRYMRENSARPQQHLSEFFKIKNHVSESEEPFYLTYGIVNEDETGFLKMAVVDLNFNLAKKNI